MYDQRLFVSLQHENPPSLSTMLKCVGCFCIYMFTLKILQWKDYRTSRKNR
nr:MAG TPA: hypothetical protein [Caudoviricetes sp.]